MLMLVRSGQHYLLLCPLARKRDDMLGLMTFCSAVDGYATLEYKHKGNNRNLSTF